MNDDLCSASLCKCLQTEVSTEPIIINPTNYKWKDSVNKDSIKASNAIKTTKYTFYNFVFLNLFEQFKRYSNIFFIFCGVLNLLPLVSAFSKETAMLPILFVLITTMIKDGYEDFQRYLSDKRVNQKTVRIYDQFMRAFKVGEWSDVQVGDFISISSNERVAADLLIYYSSDQMANTCYLETSDIDGETNLKMKNIINFESLSSRMIKSKSLEDQISEYFLEIEPPNKEIYRFSGKIFHGESKRCVKVVTNSSIALRDTILRNTEEIRGIVLYAGNQTKVLQNNIKPRFKRSLLEHQLNIDNLWCFGILIIVCFMAAIGHSLWYGSFRNIDQIVFVWADSSVLTNSSLNGFIVFLTSIIIYQSIIPLPLYVTMEFVKAHQILHIKSDLHLYNESIDKKIEVKAFNITEDLGQINHIFCDKTGTLTQNDMTFRKASIRGVTYSCKDDLHLKMTNKSSEFKDPQQHSYKKDFLMVAAVCNTTVISKESKKEKKIIHLGLDNQSQTGSIIDNQSDMFPSDIFNITEFPSIQHIQPINLEMEDPIPRDLINPIHTHELPEPSIQSSSIRRSFSTALQNKYVGLKDTTKEEFFRVVLSESPDEDALVKMAFCNGYKLLGRSNDSVSVFCKEEKSMVNFSVLKVLPFDSVRKCMSIVVHDSITNDITVFCKGADSVLFGKIDNQLMEDSNFRKVISKLKHDVDEFSREGLRTLVLAKKKITESEFLAWETDLKKAQMTFGDDEVRMKKIYDELEKDFDIIGASGIEDKLQDNVPEVLECFKEAGINIWILTGDKQETAINIAYSTKLFSQTEILLEVNGANEEAVFDLLTAHRQTIESTLKEDKAATLLMTRESCEHKEFGLVVDSNSLAMIIDNKLLAQLFIHITYFCNSVVCCRCTPIQKSEVVKLIKKNFEFRTLAVGDGANDVNMIQTADIGVGIGGKEGRQATMASDFAITEFQHLKRLLLVHGHWNYDKLARMSLYIFYKDILYSTTLFLYQMMCGFSGASAIDQITQIIFHLVYTGLPPVIFGIWEKDFDDRILLANPQIYKVGINSKMYRPRDFWRNVTDGIYQSLCVFLVTTVCYWGSEIDMSELGIVVISAVMIISFAHFLIESKHWTPFHWMSILGSLMIGFYFVLLITNSICVKEISCNSDSLYKSLQHTMTRPKTYLILFLSTSLALFPRVVIKSSLSDYRNSISYEAQRRISKSPTIKKTTTNMCSIRFQKDDLDTELHYLNNHKLSPYNLGDLEIFKKISCRKCEFINRFLSN